MKKQYDVFVVGGAGVDTVVRVDELPVPYADTIHVPPVTEWVGHTGAGVTLGLNALGLSVGFSDFIGADGQGALIRRKIGDSGVDFFPLHAPAGTRRSVNLVDRHGRRMSFYDGREAPDLKMPREFYVPLLKKSRHLHLSIIDFARHLFNDAEKEGVTVSTDLHDWDGENPHHREFAMRSDIVFFSTANVGDSFRDVIALILREGKARAVIATAGAEGSYLAIRQDGGRPRHIPAAKAPAPVVDSNGAGDAFVSAFLYGLSTERTLDECAHLGALAGAYACTAEGTHSVLISRDQLEEAAVRAV
ncbi:PfkB family carbohydrate kinase [Streptomyces werraensis]|uniref:PfkB family carbohydrate kinase n=1 Tax=Streptomyces werraensis TaxID=68284 RepID=UPI001CE364D4